jgi:hypothetical protein
VGAELFDADERTERHNEANSRFFAILRKSDQNSLARLNTVTSMLVKKFQLFWDVKYWSKKDPENVSKNSPRNY